MSGVNAFFDSSGITATKKVFTRDSVIFHQDEPNPYFYFIETGEVTLSRADKAGNEVVFISSTGERIGTLMDKEVLMARARSHEVTLMAVHKAEFARTIAASDTLIVKYLLDLEEKTIENTLRLLWAQNTSAKKDRSEKKVVNNILFLTINGRAIRQGRDFFVHMTQEDFSQLAGVTRETVSRVISRHLFGYRTSKNGVLRFSVAGFHKMITSEGKEELLSYKEWKSRVEASLPLLNAPEVSPEQKVRRKLASITKLLESLSKPL